MIFTKRSYSIVSAGITMLPRFKGREHKPHFLMVEIKDGRDHCGHLKIYLENIITIILFSSP